MNGQLNGFHEAFIEEGTFLFTSESVGEGHPGQVTGPGVKWGGGGPGVAGRDPRKAVPTSRWLSSPGGRWEEVRLRAFLVAPPVPSAWPPLPSPFLSPPLPCGRAPRHAEDSRK